MIGAKRSGVSEANAETSEPFLQSKRIMVGSQFHVPSAEPSQPNLIETSPLDMTRAESSRQHVRALNSQFASWVQTQLQNHPDELWEDGVQDYLTHASNIMEKFSDVISWLKANAKKAESLAGVGLQTGRKKVFIPINDNDAKSLTEKIGTAQASTTSGFATSRSSGVLFSNQTPFSFGTQITAPSIQDAYNNADGDDEMEQPSSPSVKKTGELGVTEVHEVKCKLYVKSTDPADKDAWKDKGAGQLFIRCKEGVTKGTRDSKPTILVRNDVGKILLNALIYPGIKTNMQKNSVVAIFHSTDDSSADGKTNKVVARTFLIRTKSEEDRDKLAAMIQEYAPSP